MGSLSDATKAEKSYLLSFLESTFIGGKKKLSHQLHGDCTADAPGSLEGPREVEEPGAQSGFQHDENGPHGSEPRLGGRIQRGFSWGWSQQADALSGQLLHASTGGTHWRSRCAVWAGSLAGQGEADWVWGVAGGAGSDRGLLLLPSSAARKRTRLATTKVHLPPYVFQVLMQMRMLPCRIVVHSHSDTVSCMSENVSTWGQPEHKGRPQTSTTADLKVQRPKPASNK